MDLFFFQLFQILFEAIRGRSYTGDIAIDDVSFSANNNCQKSPAGATTPAPPTTTTPPTATNPSENFYPFSLYSSFSPFGVIVA